MENEVSNGAHLGVVLIALAAVIALGFGVFAIAKGTANEGITNVQDSLNAVAESGFDDFNQKTVPGSTVKSALTNYKGKSYALLVNTLAMDNGQATQNSHMSVIVMNGQTDNAAVKGDRGKAFVNLNAILSSTGSNESKDYLGNAVNATENIAALASPNGGFAQNSALTNSNITGTTSASTIEFKSGTYVTEASFAMDNGNVIYDTDFSSINAIGDCMNIADNTKFKANLIKDSAGVIKGIVFEQQQR